MASSSWCWRAGGCAGFERTRQEVKWYIHTVELELALNKGAPVICSNTAEPGGHYTREMSQAEKNSTAQSHLHVESQTSPIHRSRAQSGGHQEKESTCLQSLAAST